jgi:metal-responsive CopG/Arc/MetJ family transcriptional regulator
MDTDNIRLNITLPKDLVHLIDQMSGPRKRSLFIAEAVQLKVRQAKKEALEKKLAEGYRAGYNESRGMASEFEAADLEGWDDY